MTVTHPDHGDLAPDFTADSTHGPLRFSEWAKDSWVLFSTHPNAFTPVCSTELISEAREHEELTRRGVKALSLASGGGEDHRAWAEDLERASGIPVGFPIISDPDNGIARDYGFWRRDASIGADFLSRSAVVIDPHFRIRWYVTYPQRTGRNTAELIRVLDSIRLSREYNLATPADWTQGDDVLLPGKVTTEEAEERFGEVRKFLPYIRTVTSPE